MTSQLRLSTARPLILLSLLLRPRDSRVQASVGRGARARRCSCPHSVHAPLKPARRPEGHQQSLVDVRMVAQIDWAQPSGFAEMRVEAFPHGRPRQSPLSPTNSARPARPKAPLRSTQSAVTSVSTIVAVSPASAFLDGGAEYRAGLHVHRVLDPLGLIGCGQQHAIPILTAPKGPPVHRCPWRWATRCRRGGTEEVDDVLRALQTRVVAAQDDGSQQA